MKRKLQVAKAYACPTCKRVYPYNEQGKKFSRACCICVECGKPNTRYTGLSSKRCAACHNESEWAHAADQLYRALAGYRNAVKVHKRREPKLEALLAGHADEARDEEAE